MTTQEQLVEFEGVSRFYEPGSDVNVKIRKSAAWKYAKHSDWVGIFPVGWKSLKDYVTFVYVKKMDAVAFQSAALSHSFSDSFYQFVYVSADGAVLATSYPFQFLIPFDDVTLTDLDSEEIVLIRPKQLHSGDVDAIPVIESASRECEGASKILSEGMVGRSVSCSGVETQTSMSISAPSSGVFLPHESLESLKRDRDKYMKQFRQEQKISKMQEKNFLELQNKYETVVKTTKALEDEIETTHRRVWNLEAETLQLKESLSVALDDKTGLEKEVDRLGRLVAELSRQNRCQSEHALAHKLKASPAEAVDLSSILDMDIHIARPPPYCVPGASILNHVSPMSPHDYDQSDPTRQLVSILSDDGKELECPICKKRFPKSFGSTSFQMHVNMHFQ